MPGHYLANAGILLIGALATNFSEVSITIHAFTFKKNAFKNIVAKWRPFCFGLNVLTILRDFYSRTYLLRYDYHVETSDDNVH